MIYELLVGAIKTLLRGQKDKESMFDMLTSIGLSTDSDEVFSATETIRGELAIKETQSEINDFLGVIS